MNADHDIFREWDLYHRIGHADFMRHQDISAATRHALRERNVPLRVLDLGCGDGWMANITFAESAVSDFTGVDLSASALERLERRPCPGTLSATARKQVICGDILATLQTLPDAGFDIVFASFSLHHYTTADKPAVLDAVVRVLGPDGWFVWTDSMVREDETRAAFFDRLSADILGWQSIAPEERQSVVDHVRNCDYPETATWMITALAARGLTVHRALYRDDFYGTLLFHREA